MGHADSTSRSDVAARTRRGEEGPLVGRIETTICSKDRGADHVELRSPQHRWWRRRTFAQTRNRAAGRSEKPVARFYLRWEIAVKKLSITTRAQTAAAALPHANQGGR